MPHPSTSRLCVPLAHLALRPYRINGRRVDAACVVVSHDGLLLGSESPDLPLAHCFVAPRHAFIRARADGWTLEPAMRSAVCVVNGCKLAWEEHHLLQPGDCLEIGFACLQVERCPPELPTGPPPAHLTAPQQAPPPSRSVLNRSEVPVCADGQEHDPNVALGLLLEQDTAPSLHCRAAETLDKLVQAFSDGPQYTTSPHGMENDTAGTWVSEFSASHPNESNPLVPGDPDNILLDLAAESRQALEGQSPAEALSEDLLRASPRCSNVHSSVCTPCASTGEWRCDISADETADPFFRISGGLNETGETGETGGFGTTNLEDILHGSLSIDDVLKTLREQTPADATGQTPPELGATVPLPDPLLLLAGKALAAVSPRLTPVLHREHRATGMSTPYQTRNSLKENP